jgi:LuxR family transcriptional regulator, maltose regulon positive regulatory protein
MAEPARTSPPAAGAAEPDALLATKLHVPRPHPGFVPRPRLLAHLAAGMARELTLVCAPAGFGKTTLLADWARRLEAPVAWLSLDAGDNDPIRFWRYVAAALDRVQAGIGQRVTATLQGPAAPPEAVVTVVINELASHAGQVVLVVDDYHLIEAEPVHRAVAALLEGQPHQLRLVVATRADPPLPLARLRAGGQLAELRAADLRFTQEESAALLWEATGLELPAGSEAALAAQTEGWVAGLQLAALSLRGHADPAAFVATFSGSHRYILDYLTEEVLARQPDEIVRFLLETSILDRLSGPLCDAVAGRTDSQRLLEAIERANLFLVPLDEVRGWWRYHHLFADLLQARLQQALPDRVPGLHRAAAAWCERQGLADEAIRHARAAGDDLWAARLIERHVETLYRRSETATLQRWFASLPDDLVRSRPRLCLQLARWANVAGRLDEVEPLLQATEAAVAATADEPFEPSVGRELSVLANIPAAVTFLRAEVARQRGDPERAAELIRLGLSRLTDADQALRTLARWGLAMAAMMQGRLQEAERELAEVVADPYLHLTSVRPWYDLGRIQQTLGRPDAALATFARLVEAASEAGRPLPLAGMGHVGLALVHRERNELDAALDHAIRAVALCRQLPYAQWLVTALTVLAWVRQAGGDRAGALAAMDEAGQVAPSPDVAADRVTAVGVQRARLDLAQGRVADAAHWTSQRALDANDEASYLREPELLALAWVLEASGRADQALGLLQRLHALAAAQKRVTSMIDVRALQALALDAVGDEDAALATLTQALALAAPGGYLQSFVDLGRPMAALVGKLATTAASGRAAVQPPRAFLERLVDAFARSGLPVQARPGRGRTIVAGLVEPLTARELEVLGLLAAGLPNQAIAEELVITLDTVKRHVTHILGKLAADNRTQAVARARELELLR